VLLGDSLIVDEGEWVTVKGVLPIKLVPTANGPAPDAEDWKRLQSTLTGAYPLGDSTPHSSPARRAPGTPNSVSPLTVVGSFYADPGVGYRQPRLDIQAVHRLLAPDTGLLLLVDPTVDQGVFYLLIGDTFVPSGGYYESVAPDGKARIPWSGDWLKADLAKRFDVALDAYKRGELALAQQMLAEVVQREPNYARKTHQAGTLLRSVERRLAIRNRLRPGRWGMVAAILLFVLLLALLGATFQPTTRTPHSSTPQISEVLGLQGGPTIVPTPTATVPPPSNRMPSAP
jgi:hypothetical protein